MIRKVRMSYNVNNLHVVTSKTWRYLYAQVTENNKSLI